MYRLSARFFGSRATMKSERHPEFTLRVELLEDRLPPGDYLLGLLWGGPLLAPGLLAGTGPWALEAGEAHSPRADIRPNSPPAEDGSLRAR